MKTALILCGPHDNQRYSEETLPDCITLMRSAEPFVASADTLVPISISVDVQYEPYELAVYVNERKRCTYYVYLWIKATHAEKALRMKQVGIL